MTANGEKTDRPELYGRWLRVRYIIRCLENGAADGEPAEDDLISGFREIEKDLRKKLDICNG